MRRFLPSTRSAPMSCGPGPRSGRSTAHPPQPGSPRRSIESFARLLAEGPTFLKVGPGAQRHADAGQGVRAAIMLPAVTGAWQHRGGGVLVHSAGAFAHPESKMAKPELREGRPTRDVNMVQLGRALAGTLDGEPPLTGLIVYNANPAVVAPDSNAGARRTRT